MNICVKDVNQKRKTTEISTFGDFRMYISMSTSSRISEVNANTISFLIYNMLR